MKEIKFKLLQDADIKNKIVLVRVDHNVVKKGFIHDPYRIDATLGTLFYIIAKGGKLILMPHVGRPKANKADVFVNDAFGSWQAHASTVGITK